MSKINKFSEELKNRKNNNLELQLEKAKSEHSEKFAEKLKEFGVNSPNELDDEKKKEFFNSLKESQTKINDIVSEMEEVKKQPEEVTPTKGESDDLTQGTQIKKEEVSGEEKAKEIENEINDLGEPSKLDADDDSLVDKGVENDDDDEDEELEESIINSYKRRVPSFDEFVAENYGIEDEDLDLDLDEDLFEDEDLDLDLDEDLFEDEDFDFDLDEDLFEDEDLDLD
jgi:hypothetical protein